MNFNDRRSGGDRRSANQDQRSNEPPYLTKDGWVLNDRRRLEEALKYGVVEEIEIEPLH